MSTLIHPQTVIIDGLSIRFAQGGTGPQHALLLRALLISPSVRFCTRHAASAYKSAH